jgi:hypothetical protein
METQEDLVIRRSRIDGDTCVEIVEERRRRYASPKGFGDLCLKTTDGRFFLGFGLKTPLEFWMNLEVAHGIIKKLASR